MDPHTPMSEKTKESCVCVWVPEVDHPTPIAIGGKSVVCFLKRVGTRSRRSHASGRSTKESWCAFPNVWVPKIDP